MIDEINQTSVAAGITENDLQEIAADQPLVQKPRFDFSKLTVPTAQGEIEEYQTHVLNWNGSKPVARIIRGMTGILGELNFAFLDIVIGIMEMTSKKKGAVPNDRIRSHESIPNESVLGN